MKGKHKETLKAWWLVIFVLIVVIILVVIYLAISNEPWPIPGVDKPDGTENRVSSTVRGHLPGRGGEYRCPKPSRRLLGHRSQERRISLKC